MNLNDEKFKAALAAYIDRQMSVLPVRKGGLLSGVFNSQGPEEKRRKVSERAEIAELERLFARAE